MIAQLLSSADPEMLSYGGYLAPFDFAFTCVVFLRSLYSLHVFPSNSVLTAKWHLNGMPVCFSFCSLEIEEKLDPWRAMSFERDATLLY